MNVNRILCVIVVLQSVLLLARWSGNSSATPTYGQIPDAGAQRFQTIDELKALNAKVEKIAGILESGKLQVKVVSPDETDKDAKPGTVR